MSRPYTDYQEYKKPTWAPPAWVFGPVWALLYLFIAISFGYVGYEYFANRLPLIVVVAFALNLIFNFAFTPIQFKLRNLGLATIDILLVLITLGWALFTIYPFLPWVTYINIPYLLWVTFATFLQITITFMNLHK